MAVPVWIAVIFFSSTSIAAQWCDQAFDFLAGLLFGGLRHSDSSYDIIHLLADKGFHVTLFLVLALLLWKTLPAGRWKIPAVLIFGAFIGSCSEFLQRFFPGRDPAVRDVLINTAGTALGVALSLMVTKRSKEEFATEEAPTLVGKR